MKYCVDCKYLEICQENGAFADNEACDMFEEYIPTARNAETQKIKSNERTENSDGAKRK